MPIFDNDPLFNNDNQLYDDFGNPIDFDGNDELRVDEGDTTGTGGSGGGGNGGGGGLPGKCQDPNALNFGENAACKYPKAKVFGCLNDDAINRDTTGTVTDHDESLCIFPTPTYSQESISRPVRITTTAKGANVAPEIKVNGNSTLKVTPTFFDYTEKELLTPLEFTAQYGGYNVNGRFRIYTKEKSYNKPVDGSALPSGQFSEFITFTYYEVFVESWNGEKYIPQNIPGVTGVSIDDLINNPSNARIELNFFLSQTPPPPPDLTYRLRIFGELSNDNIIGYRTASGRGGTIQNGVPLQLDFGDISDNPYIQFFGNGISSTSHNVRYQFSNSESNIVQDIKSVDASFQLYPGNNDVLIEAVKNPINPPSGDLPVINVSPTDLKLNLNSKSTLGSISYSAFNADYVEFSLGNNKKTLSVGSALSVSLTNDDFPNGVGTYTAYFQAVSELNGSSEVQKVNIVVQQKTWLPGPDIRTINYPSIIKGADFKEYDVDFEISWASINTNYILIYAGKVSEQNLLGKFNASGAGIFNVESILRKAGEDIVETRDITNFSLLFVPYNLEGDEITSGKTEQIYITFDKGDLKLRRGNVVNDIKAAFEADFDESGFQDLISPFLTHVVHIGDGDNKLVGTFGIDKDTFSEKRINPETNQEEVIKEEKSLVLKLYEPLARNINTNDRVWISKIKSIPIIDQITIIEDTTKSCIRLTPNFDLDLGDDIGYQIYDELVASGSATSVSIINQFISSSELSLDNLDIQFISSSTTLLEFDNGTLITSSNVPTWGWGNFVKYSSAEERVANFYYKVRLIESYENKISELQSLSNSGSISIQNEVSRTQTKINNVKQEFDAFEKFLYTSSSYTTETSDSLTYPFSGSVLYPTTDETVLDWYYSISNSAINYDKDNSSRLSYNLPQHIKDDKNNEEFILFFDMVGQHFDVLYFHTKGLAKSRKLEHKIEDGIKDDLIYHMLESLGWDTKSSLKSQALWEFAFGTAKDGTSISSMSGEDRQNEVWRRILNNLPYLYKHKGTKRAIHAALSCYGVPASLLTVMEFGGPKDPSSAGTTKFSFEDRTAAINISGSAAIIIPWKEYNGDHPNSVEIRVQTSTRQDQQLISGSGWSLDILKDTGSLARVQLTVGGESSSTNPIPFFNDEYSSIFINRISGSSNYSFDLYVKEAFQERVRNEGSASISSGSLDWENGSEIKIGGTSFIGSVDEFRLWKDPLDESLLDNHTLLPDAINGNHISSSTEDLLLRHDFEYPKNRHTSGDVNIKNVALIQSYATSSIAQNFENVLSYPYQYTPYDRTVTAEVPSSGFNVSNKVRFEDQTLISNLNYKTRATRKMYDQAPIDTDRLGLFFSPIKEINMDILKSLGSFNIDNYIGDPGDEYSYEYRNLRDLRNYYFDRYTLNFQEYIQMVRYIDKSLFDVLESLVPARAKVSKGLLIEPHILERSKTEWKRPSGDENYHETVIDTQDDVFISSSNIGLETVLLTTEDNVLSGDRLDYSASIDSALVSFVSGSISNYDGTISNNSVGIVEGFITRNSGSTMGGIEIIIDAQLTASIVSQYDSTQNYEQIGIDPLSTAVGAFGLYGEDGNCIRTRLDIYNNFVKDRIKVYLLTERYTELVPTTSSSLDGSVLSVPRLEEVTKFRKKLNILPFTGSDGNEMSSSIGGDIVNVEPLNGYFASHYRYVGDLTTGLENSYFNGSKQTSATTLDGGPAVQTFATNPNTLKVSDTGRGSGEPILEVD